jgi:protein-S-isoprenylcysteine O-methyltransferase Ste14
LGGIEVLDDYNRVVLPAAVLLFAATALGVPLWRLWRREGTFAVTALRHGSLTERAVAVGLIASGLLVAALSFGVIAPGDRLHELTATTPLGWALMLAGLVVVVVAQTQMGASWRIGVDTPETPTSLVTSGLYSRIRNPIYTGVFLLLGGWFVALPTFATLGVALAFCALLWLQSRREEADMRRRFGEEHARWSERTGRFFPRLF